MGRKVITPEQRAAMLAEFRKDPSGSFAAHRAAAEAAGVDRRTARRAWLTGWGPDRPAMRDVIEKERVLARAELARESLAERARMAPALAADDAAHARAQEAQLVRLARGNAIALLGVSAQSLRGALKLSERLREEVESPPAGTPPMSATRAARLLGLVAQTMHRAAVVGKLSMEMERIHLGEPTQVIGIQAVPASVSIDDAREELAAAERALALAAEEKGQDGDAGA